MITATPTFLQCREPHFDPDLKAWVLSRYADVSAALRDPRLGPSGAGEQAEIGAVDPAAHAEFRESAKLSLSPANINGWLDAVSSLHDQLYERLNLNQPIDLVAQFAQPWALQLALAVTGTDPLHADRLNNLALDIFTTAADPYNKALQASSARATQELMATFCDPLKLQTFVALAHTLPAFLSSAWLSLLEHPAETQTLIDNPDLLPNAIEELLRYAGPSRAQFRRALCDLNVNDTAISRGQQVILTLASANRDPEEFDEPDRLNIRRSAPNHVAFGGGGHACLGATLIRAAATSITRAFLQCFGHAQICGPVSWRGGITIQWPTSVSVRIQPPHNSEEQPEARGQAAEANPA